MDLDRLTEVVFVPGITGREEMIRSKILEMIPQEIEPQIDDLGNVTIEIVLGDSSIGFAADMDEIGLLITGFNIVGTHNFK